jgi:Rrf2 family transcriptional regulator, cysteine metabolism repressor
MKLSTRGRYSIRMLTYLSDHTDEARPVGLKEVAEKQGLSMRYLEQLVVPLKSAGLIRAVAGKHGGYLLARDAKEIKVGEIVEAALGPIRLLACLTPDAECDFKDVCTSRKMWGLINTRITDVLYEYTLADLSEKDMRLRLEAAGSLVDRPLGCGESGPRPRVVAGT